jgi:site-specific recombinase XerD
MKRASSLGILFYVRKDKARIDRAVPIFLRITVDGKKAEISTKRYIHPDKWIGSGQKAKGYGEEARAINEALDYWKKRVLKIRDTLFDKDEEVTAEAIKTMLDGKYKNQHTLMEAFDKYIDYISSLLGKGYAPATIKRYKTTKGHLEKFLKYKFNLSDIRLSKLDHNFARDLELFFRIKRSCNHNTSAKYIKNLKAVVNEALKSGWLDRDPFINYKIKLEEVERERLTQEELEAIENLDLELKRLDLVRDLFVFSCYTGLAYADLAKLTKNDLFIGIDGNTWIVINRKKTDTQAKIPILPQAEKIINKYKDYPDEVKKGRLLPVLSNQKLNSYLKEISDKGEIHKNITFHLARHTFATTVTLANGVPIETVSKMLAHKDIRTTQLYAKVVDRKVSKDMLALRDKLSKNETKKKQNEI